MAGRGGVRVHSVRLRAALLVGVKPMPKRKVKEESEVVRGRKSCSKQQQEQPQEQPQEQQPVSRRGGSIYVLELEQGYIYVGKTSDVRRRLMQHAGGHGSSFTTRFKPTGKRLPRLGCLEGEGDGPERDETLRQMHANGVDRVRGWKFCTRRRKLNRSQRAEAESNIRELFDLCRRCGHAGHFARFCKKRVDRHGNKI